MQAVSLPLLGGSSSVHNALARLKAMGRGGVVEENGSQYRLLDAAKLLEARALCFQLLKDIQGGDPVPLVQPADWTMYGMDPVRPLQTQAAYEMWFSKRPENYGLVGADPDTAMLVTRYEHLRDELVSTGGYECSSIPRHYFPRPPVNAGDPCPKAGCTGTIQAAP